MILLHIITQSYSQANEIAGLLVTEHLIIDALIQSGTSTRFIENSKNTESKPVNLVIGKTKALLFDTIENALRDKYRDNMPELYSIPIVNMNWEKAGELVDKTVKVSV